jgi:hypothetical protein
VIPTWWGFTLITLAVWRVWRLLAEDTIIDRPRAWIIGRSNWVEALVECPYCLGFWLSLGWVGALWLWPYWTVVAAVPWAVSAGVAVLATVVHAVADE